MKNIKNVNYLILAFFLLFSPLSTALAACCTGHGGVASCDNATGKKMCKDGTASPTCTCAVKKSTNTKVIQSESTTTVTKPAPKSHWWSSKKTPTKPVTKATVTTANARGCCSRHGGVSLCNKSTNHLSCKDGTDSPSCTCQ